MGINNCALIYEVKNGRLTFISLLIKGNSSFDGN